jgi:hypothetical protein
MILKYMQIALILLLSFPITRDDENIVISAKGISR